MADAVAFAAASTTALALHELHASTTSAARRSELQALLHRERAAAAADASLRGVWRRVLASSRDELLLWFALSTCEAYLRADAAVPLVPLAERAELKASLTEMLLGAASAELPRSAHRKGVLVLAQLARAAWPVEEPSLMQDILTLLQHPGAHRELGGELLCAVAEEFAAADARHKQAMRQAAFVALLPVAYSALAQAIDAEAAHAAVAPSSSALIACIEAARALVGFGRLRDSADRAPRTFTPDEAAALPALLLAACAHLSPTPVPPAGTPPTATPPSAGTTPPANGRPAGGRPAAAASLNALGLVGEICEMQDSHTASLVALIVEPVVRFVQRLADESERCDAPPPPSPPATPPAPPTATCAFGLDADSLDELECSLAYVLDALCGSWLLRVAPASAPLLLDALWRHSCRAPAPQLQRFVETCNVLLEAASDAQIANGTGAALTDGLLRIAPEVLSRLMLSSASSLTGGRFLRAVRDGFAGEASELWAEDVEEGRWGGPGLSRDDTEMLHAMWATDGVGGGAAGEAGVDTEGEPLEEDEGFSALLGALRRLLSMLAGGVGSGARPVEVVNFLAEALAQLLPALVAPTQQGAALLPLFDIATAAGSLCYVLPVAAAAVSAPLTELPLSSIVQMLLGSVGGQPPPSTRHHYSCRAELALLETLHQVTLTLLAASTAAVDAAVGGALASCVSALLSRAVALLPEGAGGGVTCRSASSLLLRVATQRWPVVVHDAGGLRNLASLAGEAGSLSAHAAAAGVRASCWPHLFAAVVAALLVPPKGARPAEYASNHLTPPQHAALHALIDTMVAPLRPAPPAGDLTLRVGAPASCLCAVVSTARDAPVEARAALDGALRAAALDAALQAQLSALPLATPPPLGAICSLLRLLRALTRSVGAAAVWGSEAAASWAMNAALQSIRLAADSHRCASATATEREGVIEAGLALVVSAASERRASSGGGAALVSQILEVCGPEQLGGLLLMPASGGSHASTLLLSPPLREQLISLAGALISTHWKTVGPHEPALATLLQLLAAGLMQPSDRPTFRRTLLAVVDVHERWAGGGKVCAARAALERGAAGVAAVVTGAAGGGTSALPSSALREQAMQLRCLVLAARLDPANAPIHEEAAQCLFASLKAEAIITQSMQYSSPAVGPGAAAVAVRCLQIETWLSTEVSGQLVSQLESSDLAEDGSFKVALAQLASDLATLRAEAQRSVAGFV